MSFEEQTVRIELLISMIGSSKTGTADELAEKLGVSRRTIFNDFDFLKGRGYQIVFCHAVNSYHFEKKRNNISIF